MNNAFRVGDIVKIKKGFLERTGIALPCTNKNHFLIVEAYPTSIEISCLDHVEYSSNDSMYYVCGIRWYATSNEIEPWTKSKQSLLKNFKLVANDKKI